MRILRLFPDFARRFSPLWMIWLLIILVPVSREVAQLHFWGTPLTEGYGQPWRTWFGRGDEFNGFRIARAKPRDLNAQLWRFSLMMRGSTEEEDSDGSATYIEPDRTYKPEKLLSEAQTIQKAFPREKWLNSLPSRVITERLDALSEKPTASGDTFRLQLPRILTFLMPVQERLRSSCKTPRNPNQITRIIRLSKLKFGRRITIMPRCGALLIAPQNVRFSKPTI